MKLPNSLRVAALAVFLVLSLLAGSAHAQTVLYGATGGSNPGNLYTIDPNTGLATLVGALTDGSDDYSITGLAFDSVNGILYGSTSNLSPAASSSLVAVNPLTGAVTVVGAFGTTSTMADLTFDSANSTLYGTHSVSANLYSIDLGTGQATLVGVSGLAASTGIGVASDSDGATFGTPNGAAGDLVSYDTGSGAGTVVTTLTGAPFGASGSINALSFGPSSELYGVDLNRSDVTRPSELVTINTATGAVTDIGLIQDLNGAISNMDAIEFVTAVPEASTWMSALLCAGSLVALSARRSAARHRTSDV